MIAANQGAEKYSVTETIAISARSLVRRAQSSTDGASVIVKSFNQSETTHEQRRELERELATLRQLAAPEISMGYEVCEVGGRPALILEDCGGRPLSIPEGGLGVALSLELAIQAVRALGRVHECGLIHNDINPEHLLVNPSTQKLKLIDFHQASRSGSAETATGMSSSLPYAAPERTGRVNRRPDRRADYYSLGITLFQMLTGKLPFSASDGLGWAHAHLSKQAPLASEFNGDVPPLLAELVAKLLAKNPAQRYQGSYGLLADLTTLRDGRGDELVLGERDISEDFEVSREVVGRNVELESILALFRQASSGATRLMLLAGAAGVGKSALLSELARRAARESTFLLSATFDKHALNIPFHGLAQALRGLVAQLLSRSEDDLAELKREILAKVGSNASIMTDLVPELVRVIGPQKRVAQLNPLETQHRLQHVLCAFIGVFARAEQPFVLLLDDCQWMDTSTGEALSAILTSPDLNHVFVLTAFREQEISGTPTLSELRDEVRRQAPDRLLTLELEPLDASSVALLVANSLRATTTEVFELAELVRKKTDGNPFFVGELLASFHRQGILTLDLRHGCWRQDLEGARACQVSDNVGALMAEQLDRISPAAAELLSVAACIGARFELDVLVAVAELDSDICSALIWEAVSQRLLIPVEFDPELESKRSSEAPTAERHRFAFQHARVEQAAAARLSDARRSLLHQRIGRWLEQHPPVGAARTHIFDVLLHLNLARTLLTDAHARASLAELNLKASAQAVRTGAADIAEGHAQVAVELLGEAERSLFPELAFEAYFACAAAVFQLGNGARTEALCAELFELAGNGLSRARIHLLKARILEHQGKLLEAIAEIRAGTAELGLVLPESPEQIDHGIGDGIAKMQAHLARVQVEDLADLPDAASAETRMILSLLEQIIPPAIQTYPPLFILAELLMFDLALEKGVSPASCKNLVDSGIIQAAILGNHDVAYRLGKVAFRLLERYAPTPVESGTSFVFAAFISHWKAPYQEGFAAYDRAERSGLELGDLQHVAYALAHRTQRSFLVGKKLVDCQNDVTATRAYLTRFNAQGQLVGNLVAERAVARLLAARADAEALAEADAEATARVIASKNGQWAYSYGQAQVMTAFILGDVESAAKWQEFTNPYSLAAASLFSVPDYHLFEALLALEGVREAPEQERADRLEKVEQNLQKLEAWSQACPENFGSQIPPADGAASAGARSAIANRPRQLSSGNQGGRRRLSATSRADVRARRRALAHARRHSARANLHRGCLSLVRRMGSHGQARANGAQVSGLARERRRKRAAASVRLCRSSDHGASARNVRCCLHPEGDSEHLQ